ncbi:MAG TPA: PEP-CTERM sorting domain-containing protein [Vicinamibacterales bacterium]|nr:PEP-CTERM sorting domain-containing protein [Vicinamibacterales bacterium]
MRSIALVIPILVIALPTLARADPIRLTTAAHVIVGVHGTGVFLVGPEIEQTYLEGRFDQPSRWFTYVPGQPAGAVFETMLTWWGGTGLFPPGGDEDIRAVLHFETGVLPAPEAAPPLPQLPATEPFDFWTGVAPFQMTGTIEGRGVALSVAGGGWMTAYGWDRQSLQVSEVRFFFRDAPPPVIPEPATLSLLGAGLVALGLRRLRRRRA